MGNDIDKKKIREQSLKYDKDRRTKSARKEEELQKAINALQELIESSNKGDREKKAKPPGTWKKS